MPLVVVFYFLNHSGNYGVIDAVLCVCMCKEQRSSEYVLAVPSPQLMVTASLVVMLMVRTVPRLAGVMTIRFTSLAPGELEGADHDPSFQRLDRCAASL